MRKTVVLGAISFAFFSAAPALLLASMALLTRSSYRPNPVDDFLLAAFLVVIATALATLGFLGVTALSPPWRGLTARRAIIIAGVLGFVAPIVTLFGVGLGPTLMLPLFRSAPRLATVLFYLVPGVVLGAAALLISRVLPDRSRSHSTG
jgi:ABC-type transport system involved in multi-copper enzyme maturation permease subunit